MTRFLFWSFGKVSTEHSIVLRSEVKLNSHEHKFKHKQFYITPHYYADCYLVFKISFYKKIRGFTYKYYNTSTKPNNK